MGDVPLIEADKFLQCGHPENIPEAALRERFLLAGQRPSLGIASPTRTLDPFLTVVTVGFAAAKRNDRSIRLWRSFRQTLMNTWHGSTTFTKSRVSPPFGSREARVLPGRVVSRGGDVCKYFGDAPRT
jgi:hypothetical protein